MQGDSFDTAPQVRATMATKKTHKREMSGHICTACDQCYRCKVKCTGEKPECERCRINKSACTYSKGKPLGKPKGSKNKVQKSKSTINEIPSTDLTGEETRSPSLQVPVSRKRSFDGDLPPVKRRAGSTKREIGSIGPANGGERSPQLDTSELHQFDPRLTLIPPIQDTTPCDSEPTSYLVEDDPIDGAIPPNPTCSPKDGEGPFIAVDSALSLDDLKWFGHTEDIIQDFSTSASPAVELPVPTMTLPDSGATTLHTSPVTQVSIQEDHTLKPEPLQYFSLPCLCDPMALNIISELQFLQTSLSPLDTALILARRGFSTVSSSLSCPACLSSSRSLFYACVLIIQQVFTCYGTVKVQGQKMLSATAQEQPKTQSSTFSIGEFEVDDEEGCNGILDAIVKAEMERGKGVIGGLERWVQNSASGSPKAATLLLRTLREEIGC